MRAGSWIHRHDRRARLRPRRHRTGTHFPEPGDDPARAEERMVLDRAAGADHYLCGLLPLVQEGAINEALSGLAGFDRLEYVEIWDDPWITGFHSSYKLLRYKG